jgi:hypothetical protein
MDKKLIARSVRAVLIFGVFSLGYFLGSLSPKQADAQLGGVMEQAGRMGGPLGTVKELGSSIVEMQEHVNGLQKNLDTLKKVQAGLTGK